jgi:hypothetical protein
MRAVDLNVKAGKLADTYEHMQVWLDQNGSCTLFSRAASCKSRITGSITALVGFTRKGINLACGTSSQRNVNRLGLSG